MEADRAGGLKVVGVGGGGEAGFVEGDCLCWSWMRVSWGWVLGLDRG